MRRDCIVGLVATCRIGADYLRSQVEEGEAGSGTGSEKEGFVRTRSAKGTDT